MMIEEVEVITTIEITMITEITETIEITEVIETEEIIEIIGTTEMAVKETTITKVETESRDIKKRTHKMTNKLIDKIPTRMREEVGVKEMIDHQEKLLNFQMRIWVNFSERTLNCSFKLKSITNILMNKMMKKTKRTKKNQSKIRSQEDTILKCTNVSLNKMERKRHGCCIIS